MKARNFQVEFETMVISIVKELSENFNSIKKGHENYMKGPTEMKNILQGISRRVDEAKDQISHLEDEAETT